MPPQAPQQQQMTAEQQEELRKKLENMSPEELREFQKKQCIFCHIISGRVAAKKVYEDAKTLAILDINPANPGHILLMPKEHYMIMPQMPEEELKQIFVVAKYLSNALLKALDVRGTNIIVANGPAAGQRAQHFMLHIIPRKEGDGLQFTLPSKKNSEEELDKIADTVSKKLGELIGTKPKEKTAEDILREKSAKKEVLEKKEEHKDTPKNEIGKPKIQDAVIVEKDENKSVLEDEQEEEEEEDKSEEQEKMDNEDKIELQNNVNLEEEKENKNDSDKKKHHSKKEEKTKLTKIKKTESKKSQSPIKHSVKPKQDEELNLDDISRVLNG